MLLFTLHSSEQHRNILNSDQTEIECFPFGGFQTPSICNRASNSGFWECNGDYDLHIKHAGNESDEESDELCEEDELADDHDELDGDIDYDVYIPNSQLALSLPWAAPVRRSKAPYPKGHCWILSYKWGLTHEVTMNELVY